MGFSRLFTVAILVLITVLVGAFGFKVLFKGFSGKSIRNAGLREEYGLLVAGVVDESGKVNISPGPDTVLENNQILMPIGKKENLKELKV